jgi:hypothetical protein
MRKIFIKFNIRVTLKCKKSCVQFVYYYINKKHIQTLLLMRDNG